MPVLHLRPFDFSKIPKSKGWKTMKTINLKDYYPCYTQNTFVEVPDELFAIFEEYASAEAAYERKKYCYKTYYSLDRGDGIKHDILFVSLSPDEIY